MSIETTPAVERAEQVGRELGEVLTELPAYQDFAEAKAAVEGSEEAQEKIQEFEQLRQEFMLARQTGEASREDLRKLQRTQQDLHDIPVMDDYLEAQEELERQLERVNEAISEPLALDFGENVGGCCQD